MSNLALLPIEDNFQTTLSSPMTDSASDLILYCDAVPTATIPATFKVAVVVDAGTSKEEVMKVSSIDTGANTMTVTSGDRAQNLGNGYAGSLQTHSIGATVTISDSYIYWDAAKTAINSKADLDSPSFTTYVKVPVYATTAARDAAITSPSNGMLCYVTADGVIYQYIAGAWAQNATGTTANATTAVAGKIELATQAELNAGTATGGTGASLVATPDLIAVASQNQTHNYFADTGAANAIVITPTPAISAYATGQRFAIKVAAANTGATTINVNGLGAKNLYKNTSSALVLGDLLVGQMIEAEYDGTQFQLVSPVSNSNKYLTESYTAFEAITADQAVAKLPIQVEFFSQQTAATLALGDSNVRRKHSIKLPVAATTTTLTTMQMVLAEQVGGATALGDLTISIQSDNGSGTDASGTAITNGTANVISQATQRTWNTTFAARTITWATPPTLTAGTIYWLVIECAATDAANYLKIGVNSSYDEHYLTFTRRTYNLDTTSWGTTTTDATPFFWFDSQPYLLGFAVVPTDADFAGRAWSFVGFAASTVAAQVSVDVYYDVVPTSSRIADGNPYYLSSTAGAITQTKPGNLYDGNAASYEIGYALSATEFKIKKGEKLYFGRLTPTGSATTAHTILSWFKPRLMEISGSYLSTANILDTTVEGIFDGTSNYQTGIRITNGAAPSANFGAGGTATSTSFGHDTSAYWQGVGASVTNVGLTYTVTKTSTPADYNIIYTLRG